MKHDFADGKYTVEFDEKTGDLTALRHGEPWMRDIVGDKLILSMLQEVDNLKAQVETQQQQLTELYNAINDAVVAVREQKEALELEILERGERIE